VTSALASRKTEADLAALLATVSSARIGQAEAAVAQAQRQAVKAIADLQRIEPLASRTSSATAARNAARARQRAAEAQLAAAQAMLVGADSRGSLRRVYISGGAAASYTRITAPAERRGFEESRELGPIGATGQPLMSRAASTCV